MELFIELKIASVCSEISGDRVRWIFTDDLDLKRGSRHVVPFHPVSYRFPVLAGELVELIDSEFSHGSSLEAFPRDHGNNADRRQEQHDSQGASEHENEAIPIKMSIPRISGARMTTARTHVRIDGHGSVVWRIGFIKGGRPADGRFKTTGQPPIGL